MVPVHSHITLISICLGMENVDAEKKYVAKVGEDNKVHHMPVNSLKFQDVTEVSSKVELFENIAMHDGYTQVEPEMINEIQDKVLVETKSDAIILQPRQGITCQWTLLCLYLFTLLFSDAIRTNGRDISPVRIPTTCG